MSADLLAGVLNETRIEAMTYPSNLFDIEILRNVADSLGGISH